MVIYLWVFGRRLGSVEVSGKEVVKLIVGSGRNFVEVKRLMGRKLVIGMWVGRGSEVKRF